MRSWWLRYYNPNDPRAFVYNNPKHKWLGAKINYAHRNARWFSLAALLAWVVIFFSPLYCLIRLQNIMLDKLIALNADNFIDSNDFDEITFFASVNIFAPLGALGWGLLLKLYAIYRAGVDERRFLNGEITVSNCPNNKETITDVITYWGKQYDNPEDPRFFVYLNQKYKFIGVKTNLAHCQAVKIVMWTLTGGIMVSFLLLAPLFRSFFTVNENEYDLYGNLINTYLMLRVLCGIWIVDIIAYFGYLYYLAAREAKKYPALIS